MAARRMAAALTMGAALAVATCLHGAMGAAPDDTGQRFEVNAMEYPWSAIGRVNVAGHGHCTGFLVGARAVLTAAHCLYDPVEGRWLGPGEIHFVAGYQRDAYLIHSPVRSYERSRLFDFAAGPTPDNAVADWAILELEQPIGRRAGWLGLHPLDAALVDRLRRGDAKLAQAGYRKDQSHIMSVSLGCALVGSFHGGAGILHSCHLVKGDSGSPLLAVTGDGFRVVGMHVLHAQTSEGDTAGAVSVALFQPGTGAPEAVAAARRAGAAWERGHAPGRDSLAAAVPLNTIDRLLRAQGLLAPAPAADDPVAALTVDPAAERAAIAAFQEKAGLPVDGEGSVALLGHLILATP